ncbi:MAG: hypothetical protein AAF560_16835 [Acidobacteriota bacterium]
MSFRWLLFALTTMLLVSPVAEAAGADTGPAHSTEAESSSGDGSAPEDSPDKDSRHEDSEHQNETEHSAHEGDASHDDDHASNEDGSKHEDSHDEGHGEEHGKGHGKKHSSRLTDEKIPLQTEGFPQRPKPILELGEPFLGTGTLSSGIRLPTGAVWQPSLLAFGTFRTAIQTFEPDNSDGSRITEWTNRLDLFLNLQLSGSERLVVGVRALDEDGRFTSYFFENPDESLEGTFQDSFDAQIEALYFEGDFGEIFPDLDRDDFGSTDVGFSVGRQPMLFQEGMLIDDTLDGIGFTRNTLLPRNTSNFRLTFFYGWDNININNAERRSANLWALLSSTDFRKSTIDFDVAYLQTHDDTGDLVTGGISAVQRIGKTNSAFRILGSVATDEETTASTDGILLFSELSWTPHYTYDHVYLTTFAAFDEFTPAARGAGPAESGPLGRAGINFAAVGIGSFGAPLSGRARDVVGGAFGYQRFFNKTRQQLIVELGARVGIDDQISDSYAATARYQTAVGRRLVVITDGFVGYDEATDRVPFGGRLELLLKF